MLGFQGAMFYDRFSEGLTRMFRAVLNELLAKLEREEWGYGGALAGFRTMRRLGLIPCRATP